MSTLGACKFVAATLNGEAYILADEMWEVSELRELVKDLANFAGSCVMVMAKENGITADEFLADYADARLQADLDE